MKPASNVSATPSAMPSAEQPRAAAIDTDVGVMPVTYTINQVAIPHGQWQRAGLYAIGITVIVKSVSWGVGRLLDSVSKP